MKNVKPSTDDTKTQESGHATNLDAQSALDCRGEITADVGTLLVGVGRLGQAGTHHQQSQEFHLGIFCDVQTERSFFQQQYYLKGAGFNLICVLIDRVGEERRYLLVVLVNPLITCTLTCKQPQSPSLKNTHVRAQPYT